jgi:CHASE2 domain-containing sensor protein
MTLEQLANVAEFLGLLIVAVTLVFLTVRVRRSTTYRSAVGLALAAPFLLCWINLAVGIIGEPDDPANLMYIGVLAVGIIGAIIARFQPHGMARALFATALAQALVAVITLIAGLGSPATGPRLILTFNGFFVALWLGSAWLFRRAAREQPPAGARPVG